MAQPPQVPKYAQRGRTRWLDSESTSVTVPRSKLPRLRRRAKATRSPVMPPSMKVTLPSTCATPTPSWSMDSIVATPVEAERGASVIAGATHSVAGTPNTCRAMLLDARGRRPRV